MSFLTRLTPSTSQLAGAIGRTMTPALSVAASRSLSSSAKNEKGPMETTKDTLKKADKTFSDAALKGIETGEHARDKIRDTVGSSTHEAEPKSGKMKGEASKVAQEGKGKAEKTFGEAKEKGKEAMG